ncbi:low-density lipoprotein receptor-related protein 8-like [Drosophila miranda]|uniref:low-density lipoprotein receptor-related protein 8-like n=1 Tax=Drosophila miranda TaxID=7229 RepID=UPI0007E897DA|nr:low-density lipoprotein receptor-related protein 8-like [Drosophila miranda]
MLLEDKENYGAYPACGPDHFTCAAPVAGNSDMNKDSTPASWRCEAHKDYKDKSDEVGCPTCRVDQFSCQSSASTRLWSGMAPRCGHDEVDCCKWPGDFQCPINKLCISATLLCDGWELC